LNVSKVFMLFVLFEQLETDSDKLQAQAKELIHLRQKNRALLLLKLRKYKEKELDNVDAQLLSVFKMIEDIEWESANMEVLKALKVGTDALNKIHEEMSVEDVEALLAETNEAIEVIKRHATGSTPCLTMFGM
jgi:charged multivesicular body protein 6